MAIHYNSKITLSDLSLYYDTANTKKSWFGRPTTNLLLNADFKLGTDNNFTYWTRTNTSNINVISDKYLSEDCIKLTRDTGGTGFNGIRGNSPQFLPNTTYTITIKYAVPYNMSRGLRIYVPELAGAPVYNYRHYFTALNLTQGWQTFTYTFTTDSLSTSFSQFSIDWDTNASTQLETIYIKSIQFEQNTFSTPFVNGTRSNTQSLIDLTGKNTLISSSLTYASDNTFSFNGTSDRILTGLTINNPGSTWSAWVRCTESVNTYNMFMGSYLPYFSFYGGNRLYFSNIIGGTQQTISSPATLLLNTWYHATFTTLPSGSNTISSIYINGDLITSSTLTGLQSAPSSNFTIGDAREVLWYPFKGNVSMVKVYNKTLTAVEIKNDFNSTRGRYSV